MTKALFTVGELHQLLLVLLSAATLVSAVDTHADPQRVYTDQELTFMPAQGPSPYLSTLLNGAHLDWNYWRQRAAFESRKNQQRQAAEPQVNRAQFPEAEPNNNLADANFVAGFGTGFEEDRRLTIAGSIGADGSDIDCFSLDLEPGDTLGTGSQGTVTLSELYDPSGDLKMGSTESNALYYPNTGPLPDGVTVTDFVAHEGGVHTLCVQGRAGEYTLQVEVYRSPLEGSLSKQIFFVDFDGATIDPSIFVNGTPGEVDLTPFAEFLPNWGLTPADESAVIDEILATLTENLTEDLALKSNPNFKVEFRNSRDHADPWGEANVSRLIISGKSFEVGFLALGIAQSIDPGNLATEETAIVMLDFLSGSALDPNSLNRFELGGTATKIELVGRGVGNIASHEAGHILGSWHTQPTDQVEPGIMTGVPNLADRVGVGPDGIFGTADDVDSDFQALPFLIAEGFTGTEHTDERSAFGLTGNPNVVFADGFESGNLLFWSLSSNP